MTFCDRLPHGRAQGVGQTDQAGKVEIEIMLDRGQIMLAERRPGNRQHPQPLRCQLVDLRGDALHLIACQMA